MMVLWMWLDRKEWWHTPARAEANQKPIILLPYAATKGANLLSDFAVILLGFLIRLLLFMGHFKFQTVVKINLIWDILILHINYMWHENYQMYFGKRNQGISHTKDARLLIFFLNLVLLFINLAPRTCSDSTD